MFDFEDLVRRIRDLDSRAQGDQSAVHAGYGDLGLEYADFPIDPANPETPAYRSRQLEIYEAISGRRYALDNEQIPFDIDAAYKLPCPFSTSNSHVIGDHLSTLGFVVTNFDMPRGSRVFEMGAGWGNLALTLAKTGYVVGACDLEARFVELVRRRAAQDNVQIDIEKEDFLNSRSLSKEGAGWDAIVFNACFHHCDDPLGLLDKIATNTKYHTKIYFIGESIYRDYPWPWGINLHGQAIYCINKFGWLELAFNEDFFLNALYGRGYTVRRWQATHSPLMTMLKASKFTSYEGNFVPFVDLCQPQSFERSFASAELSAQEQGRWTSGMSRFQIPDNRLKAFGLVLANYKPVATQVVVTNGANAYARTILPGTEAEIEIEAYTGNEIMVWAECHNPKALKWSVDDRDLGIYCKGIRLTQYE